MKYAHYFVIPGLFHLPKQELAFLSGEQYPCLTRLLTRSKRLESSQKNLDAVLSEQLKLETLIVPFAQFFKQSQNVLIATPIILKADINSTWIQPAQSSGDISLIIKDMVQFFAEDINLIDEANGHYILEFKTADVVENLPHYLSVLGKKMDAYQDSIRENLDWFKLVNEMQMFLHGHALNKNEAGQQLLNSLWFWGGDSQQVLNHEQYIRCDDSLMQMVLSNDDKHNPQRLMIKTDLLKYLKLNSSLQLEAFFYQLEQDLKGVNIKHICIDTAEGHQYVYDRLSPFKFWQTPPSLLDVLTQNEII